eukprot:CFRG7895T1
MESKQELAAYILRDRYGDIVESVGCALMTRGPSSFKEIKSRTPNLLPKFVRESLVVLLQHNIVEAESVSDVKKGSTNYVYTININQILTRLRFPQYKAVTKSLFTGSDGIAAVKVVEHLWLTGRQTIGQLANTIEDLCEDHKEVNNVLRKMVANKLIRRARRPRQIEVDVNDFRNVVENDNSQMDFEMSNGYLGRIVSGQKKRKAVELFMDESEKRTKLNVNGLYESSTFGSSNFGTLEAGEDVVLWRLNEKQYHIHLRNAAIIDLVKLKSDQQSAVCVQTMLNMCVLYDSFDSPQENTNVRATSAPIGAYQVFKQQMMGSNESTGDGKVNAKDMVLLLDALRVLTGGVVDTADGASDGVSQYIINFTLALEVLQNATIESLMRDRFGTHCERVYRLMREKGKLEQKQIAELAMIDFKDARAQTHKLLTAGILQIQEVPRTAVRATSQTIFLLSHERTRAETAVVSLLMKAIKNLIVRRRCLMQKYAKLLDKIVRDLGRGLANDSEGMYEILLTDPQTWVDEEEVLNAKEKEAVGKLQRSLDRISAALLLIDKSLLVMNGFA